MIVQIAALLSGPKMMKLLEAGGYTLHGTRIPTTTVWFKLRSFIYSGVLGLWDGVLGDSGML